LGHLPVCVVELGATTLGSNSRSSAVVGAQVKATQESAKNTFDAINNQVALIAP
jgi:hypothetical protein